jgi:release factor glutamine methyltransferase
VKTIGEYYTHFIVQLSEIYEKEEAEQVAFLAFENILNFRRIDISMNKNNLLEEDSFSKLTKILEGLLEGKPVQYVLGSAWFYGLKVMLNENVLIPRQETEELVHWILNDMQGVTRKSTILDICTGSGCIALAIKKRSPDVTMMGVDVSEKALDVAKVNSHNENLDIRFIQCDVLTMTLDLKPDIVVSNPPYVLNSERDSLHSRVKDFEPELALFVPDSDPVLFYRKIAGWSMQNLSSGGKIYFEINETKLIAVKEVLENAGFVNIVVKKDLRGKDRMVKAEKI